MKLFTAEKESNGDTNDGEFVENYDSISMTTDEIIEFLQGIEEVLKKNQAMGGRERQGAAAAQRNDGETTAPSLKKRFLEQITEDPRTEPKYFTMLGRLLIQQCVDMRADNNYGRAF